MLRAEYTTQFKRDLNRAQRRNLDIERLKSMMFQLCMQEELPVSARDHELVGTWKKHRECHIQPDWLLIYFVNPATNTIHFVRTGTHADLFD